MVLICCVVVALWRGVIPLATTSAADPSSQQPAQVRAEIVAHRGASHDAPENTVRSMRLAWEQGADAIEMDIHLSKDGQIVVIHDSTTQRVAGVNRKVVEQTFDELRKLDVGRWKGPEFAGERIPTLGEVLATVPPGKRAFIEIKCGPEIIPVLDQTLKESGLKPEQIVIISFSDAVIAAMKKARPDLTAMWIVSLHNKAGRQPPSAAELLMVASRIKADGLDLSANPDVLTPEYAAMIKKAGLKLAVWTVNDPRLARRMIEIGVESITTDRPGWLRQQLQTK